MSCPKKILSVTLAFILAISLSLPAFAAPSLQNGMIRDMLGRLNKARKSAGLAALALDDDLQAAAQIRALEIAQKYTSDHSRPNGQKAFSASTKIWGENIARGYKDEYEVMVGWLDSKGHRANILDKRFTIVGLACSEGDDGRLYWVQSFGTSKSNMFWAMRDFGVKSFTLDPFNDPKTPLDKAKKASSAANTGLIDKDGVIITSAIGAELTNAASETKSGPVTIKIKNAKAITPETCGYFALFYASYGREATILADTLASNGKSVQGRIVLEPSKLYNRKTGIKLGVYTDKDSIANVKAAMQKRSNNTMTYIHMEHQGSLTINTRVTAKVDLTGLDTKNLLFYVCDGKQDSVTLIDKPEYSISNSYISFLTKTGGDIVITDKKL